MSDPEADQKKRTVAGVFDRVAATYSRVGPPFFAHFAERLVELARIPEGARVLDIATGRGAVLFLAAKRVGPTGNVIGIDLSSSMVKSTARDARERGLANVELQRMDAEDLRFPDDSFDQVLCGLGLFFLPRPRRALSEIRRVLKPGGHVAVSTWGRDEGAWERLYDVRKRFVPPEPAAVGETKPDFETPEGMRSLMHEAGFEDVRVMEQSADFVYASIEEWWSTQWSHGARGTLEKIEATSGKDGLARFQSEVSEHLRAMERVDGIHHPMRVLVTLATNPERS